MHRNRLLAASGNAASHVEAHATGRWLTRHWLRGIQGKQAAAALSALSSKHIAVISISYVRTAGPVHETRHGADGCSPLPSCFRELFRIDALSGLGWDLNLKPTPGAWPYGTGTRPNILNAGTSFHFKFV